MSSDIIKLLAGNIEALCRMKGITHRELLLQDEDRIKLENLIEGKAKDADLEFLARVAQALDIPVYLLLK